MPKAVLVNRGKECLPDVPLAELEEMYRHEPPGKSVDGLQAAIFRKRDKMIVEIVAISGRHHPSTIHRWLHRLERECSDGRYDRWSPGRPRLLALEQERSIKEDLGGPPSDSGFVRGSWNAGMLARRIVDKFDVITCSRRTALRIADRLGFSTCKPWSIPYNSATTPEEQAVFIEETRGPSPDGTRRDASCWSSTRPPCGTRPPLAGASGGGAEKSIVRTNHFEKSIHLIGTLGDGAPDLPFHDNLKADGHAALAEYARRRHKKVGHHHHHIADNAGALTGKTMSEYIAGTDGAVEMVHIPSHTPQLNPIETEWREIRAAIADIFFGGLDKMRDAIIYMLHNGEI